MKSIIIFILIIFSLTKVSAKEKYLILADDGYPPYSFSKKNSIADGLYHKILSEIFPKMKSFKIIIEAIPWKRGLAEVKEENAFAIYPAYFRPSDPERNWMDYSDNIYKEKVVLYCNKKILGKGKWPEDFRGLIIGKNRGNYGKSFDDILEKNGIKLVEDRNTEKNFVNILTKKIDCIVNEETAIEIFLQRYKDNPEVKEISKKVVISSETTHLGFLKKSSQKYQRGKEFIKEFNKELKKLKNSGLFEKIRSNYIENYK
ncbi:substrate-binding periplasmic protein [Fluviispira sanaruensis]|uniref:Solute-binding protein family 3/N-terminal domain-containing protein n=1 Tax=Fluviispira sanaruensis TaxID=2493639 RepID=A0A4P2VLH4_FLUSA|nr:ABC transporter substrate-binding protein [Fluviispira sanaruensis]BBH54176.1 hypothetical protein JCM31447_26340 [Fluviispira sanaruensis]